MNIIIEPFTYDFMHRAFLVCLFVGFANGMLGTFVVLQRMALVADALSHSLLPGLAIALVFVGFSPLALIIGGFLAMLFVAFGGHLITRSSRIKHETAIAALYIFALALGIVLLKFSNSRVSLEHFLFGNILAVGAGELWICFTALAVTLVCLVVFQRPVLLAIFDATLARTQGIPVGIVLGGLVFLIVLAMVASLQAVGVLLSLGLLVLPAATIYLLTDRYELIPWLSGTWGAVGACVGLLVSFWFSIPSGPAIVLVLGVAFLLAYVFSPRYGIFKIKRRHIHYEPLRRWQR